MRYLPLTRAERSDMLATIGVASIDDLFKDVPQSARRDGLVNLPLHQGELAVEREMKVLAAKNLNAEDVPFFLGCGAYHHHIPATVDHVIQRSEFLTSYTPYQPEIAQGTLQYLFEFQSMVAALTGLDVANASMYDISTGAAEAVMMAGRITKRKKVVLSGTVNPQYTDVIATNASLAPDEIRQMAPLVEGTEDIISLITDETAAVVVQTPGLFGGLTELDDIAEAAHAKGALLIALVPEVVSLGLVRSPGEMGADIVVAEGQSLGVPMSFGGPYVGLFATRQKYLRQMPGRLCGETVDNEGRRGYVLTMSAREQHIRREKATSNICTNSGLCCLAFTIHLSLLGEDGFTHLAELNHESAVKTASVLEQVSGVSVLSDTYFNEFAVKLTKPAEEVVEALAAKGVLGGIPASRLYPDDSSLSNVLLVASTEMVTMEDRAQFVDALEEVLGC